MLQWVVIIKEHILIAICGFSVYSDVESSVIFIVHCAIYKSHSFNILLSELDVAVHCM